MEPTKKVVLKKKMNIVQEKIINEINKSESMNPNWEDAKQYGKSPTAGGVCSVEKLALIHVWNKSCKRELYLAIGVNLCVSSVDINSLVHLMVITKIKGKW